MGPILRLGQAQKSRLASPFNPTNRGGGIFLNQIVKLNDSESSRVAWSFLLFARGVS